MCRCSSVGYKNIHVIIKCERSEPVKKIEIELSRANSYNFMRAKRARKFKKLICRKRSERKFFGKLCTFPPKSSKFRSDYLFSFQKRTDYLFPGFLRSEYLFPKSARPPLRIKWSSPKSRQYDKYFKNKNFNSSAKV